MDRKYVRDRPLWVISGQVQCTSPCPLYPNSGHVRRTSSFCFGPIADIAVYATLQLAAGVNDEKTTIRFFAGRGSFVASARTSAAAGGPHHRLHERPVA